MSPQVRALCLPHWYTKSGEGFRILDQVATRSIATVSMKVKERLEPQGKVQLASTSMIQVTELNEQCQCMRKSDHVVFMTKSQLAGHDTQFLLQALSFFFFFFFFLMIGTEQNRHRKGAGFLYVEITLIEGVFKGKIMWLMIRYGVHKFKCSCLTKHPVSLK